MRFMTFLSVLLLASTVYGQSIVTPVFVHKDGEASASGYAGSEKDILVDGTAQESVGWIVFQTAGVDFSKVSSAKLTLYVKSVQTPGTLGIYPLTAEVTAPENNLPLASVPVGATAAAAVSLGTADVGKMVQVDLTTIVKSGAFYGVALKSEDGLLATFDAKEGSLAPVILLTYDVESAASKWHSGTTAPEASLGKDRDYYLNTATGDVSYRNGGVWSVAMNVIGYTGPAGPKGDKGDTGDQGAAGATGPAGPAGAQGPKGDQGDAGAQGAQGPAGPTGEAGHSPVTTSANTLTIASSGSVNVTLAGNHNAFAVGQRIRIASTANVSNFMEGTISTYDALTGVAQVALDYSQGSGTNVSSWSVMSAGIVGDQGPTGATGPQGETGATGPKGETGPQGETGATGPQGETGPQGATGATGPQGETGPQGATGATGAAGADGHSPATTSSTSLTVSRSGNASLTLASNRNAFGVGQRVRIASTATPANWMEGAISDYNATTGAATVACDNSAGNGTYSAWTVTVAGTPGQREIPGVVIDIDGNSYTTIIIGNQEWTLQNLRVTKYNNGNSITNITTNNTAWSNATTGAFCWYDNTTDIAARQKWGALYNWYAVNTGKLAPAGWRVPTDEDWTTLTNYLIANGYNGDGTTSGNEIGKSLSAQTDWAVSIGSGHVGNGAAANNRSGFSALAGGERHSNGYFYNQNSYAYLWSATEYDASNAIYYRLFYGGTDLGRYDTSKRFGYSVRLVRDLN